MAIKTLFVELGLEVAVGEVAVRGGPDAVGLLAATATAYLECVVFVVGDGGGRSGVDAVLDDLALVFVGVDPGE